MAKKPEKRVSPPRSPGRSRSRSVMPLAVGTILLGGIIAIALSVGGESSPGTTGLDPASVAQGSALYAANCAVCHGTDLRGTATGPPFINVIYAPNHHADEAFQRAVEFGVVPHHWNFGTMAPLPGLTREQVALIVAFVRSEQQAAGIFEDPSH